MTMESSNHPPSQDNPTETIESLRQTLAERERALAEQQLLVNELLVQQRLQQPFSIRYGAGGGESIIMGGSLSPINEHTTVSPTNGTLPDDTILPMSSSIPPSVAITDWRDHTSTGHRTRIVPIPTRSTLAPTSSASSSSIYPSLSTYPTLSPSNLYQNDEDLARALQAEEDMQRFRPPVTVPIPSSSSHPSYPSVPSSPPSTSFGGTLPVAQIAPSGSQHITNYNTTTNTTDMNGASRTYDEIIAQRLQQEEFIYARTNSSQQYPPHHQRSFRSSGSGIDSRSTSPSHRDSSSAVNATSSRTGRQVVAYVEDPVWGRYEQYAPTHSSSSSSSSAVPPPKPHVILCLSCCPCCVPPYCSPERKAAYSRVFTSAAFIFSLIQIMLMVISLLFRGLAPTDVNSMIGPWPDTLNMMYAKNSALIIYKYEVWRLVTPIFLHSGIIHIATNLLMQLRLGLYLEISWGMHVWLPIYIFGGIFANIYSSIIKYDSISVGASGALMSILGAWLIALLSEWGGPPRPLRYTRPTPPVTDTTATTTTTTATNRNSHSIHTRSSSSSTADDDQAIHSQRSSQFMICIINIAIVIAFSFTPYIDWAAHLGGLISGILLGGYFFIPTCATLITNPYAKIVVSYVCLFLYLALGIGGIIILYSGIITPHVIFLDFCTYVQELYRSYNLRCPY